MKLKLPDWTKKYFNKMKELAMLNLASLTFTPTSKKLKGGPLIKEVVQHMSQRILGLKQPSKKIYLYSSHDVTLISVLRALGIEDIDKPDYGSSIIFELHQKLTDGDHFVKVYTIFFLSVRNKNKN